MVLGEAQIQAQVKEALRLARDAETAGTIRSLHFAAGAKIPL